MVSTLSQAKDKTKKSSLIIFSSQRAQSSRKALFISDCYNNQLDILCIWEELLESLRLRRISNETTQCKGTNELYYTKPFLFKGRCIQSVHLHAKRWLGKGGRVASLASIASTLHLWMGHKYQNLPQCTTMFLFLLANNHVGDANAHLKMYFVSKSKDEASDDNHCELIHHPSEGINMFNIIRKT